MAGLLGQGMTAAGLQAILQQQSHRMPPDMVRRNACLHVSVHTVGSVPCTQFLLYSSACPALHTSLSDDSVCDDAFNKSVCCCPLQLHYFATVLQNLQAAEATKPDPGAIQNQHQVQASVRR